MITYRFRIYPSSKQFKRLSRQFLLVQELYNTLLQRCKDEYKENSKTMSKYQLNNIIKEIKANDERFKAIHSQVLQNITDRITKAYANFFRRVKEKKQGKHVKVGFPRFKKFYKSITYPQSGFKFKSDKRLFVSKVGSVSIVLHRPIKGTIKTLTIKRMQSGSWYACFSVENIISKVKHPCKDKQIGIDVGLEYFASLSDGSHIENPRYLIESEKRLKRLQRRLSRKKKGSNNRRKARVKVARCHEKITDRRVDFLHKLSSSLIGCYGFIAVEKLNINGMLHNHHLAKSISDASWNEFIQMLCYKASSAGGKVVCVNPDGTSQICSNCGTNVPKTLAVRMHICPNCEFEIHRDVNSALNILNNAMSTVGLTESHACGDSASTSCSKQEASGVAEAGTICG